MTERRQHALDAAEHIIKMLRSGEDDDNCLSEGADVILEAFDAMSAHGETGDHVEQKGDPCG
jgi:hypothetical protein